jgi:hypothetical protein
MHSLQNLTYDKIIPRRQWEQENNIHSHVYRSEYSTKSQHKDRQQIIWEGGTVQYLRTTLMNENSIH